MAVSGGPGFTNVRYDFVVENAAIRFADGVDTSPVGISSFHFVFVPFPGEKREGRKEGMKADPRHFGSEELKLRRVSEVVSQVAMEL